MEMNVVVYELQITFETDMFGKRLEGTRQLKSTYLPDRKATVTVKPNMELVDQLVDFLPADFLTLRFGKNLKDETEQITEWDGKNGQWVTYRVYGEGHTRIANLAADYLKGNSFRLRAPHPDVGVALTK